MAYLVDRSRALYGGDLVAVMNLRQPRVRSRVVLVDNSLYHTLTRPKTLIAHANTRGQLRRVSLAERLRIRDQHSKGATWRIPR